ncbi:MAG: hypothetical protein HYU54_10370, partial [Actinobacteria bacterium]|nr:hypothetical protein [Actinomycetota bacterium]
MTNRARTSPVIAALVGFGLVAAACVSAGAEGDPTIPATSRPAKVDTEEFPTQWPIKHVVFIIKENRSFDHMFGLFPGANGATTGMDHGI